VGDDRRLMNPWHDLLARAERELSLAREGRWEELAEAGAERVRLAATLPAPAPAVRPLLERALRVQAQIDQRLTVARAHTARELGTLHRGRGAVRGYAPVAGAAGGWVDERS
jgi:hypothetical protein